jgi:arabinoxylan arabinofuranohydrolase
MKKSFSAALTVLLLINFTLIACSNGDDDTPPLSGSAQVTFDLGYSGAPAISPITVESGKAAGDAWPAAPVRVGYTFGGWYAGETVYDAQTAITGDAALTARWSPAVSLIEDQPSATELAALFDDNLPAELSNSWKIWGHKNPLFTGAFGADPNILIYEGRLYIYMSNDTLEYDANGSLHGTPSYAAGIQGIRIVSSSDLANWTDHGAVNIVGPANTNPLVESWPQVAEMPNVRASWAPTATWKEINGRPRFFLYWANSGNGIGVVTSNSSPAGPWASPLDKLLIDRDTPTCASVEYLFDPSVFIDDDGQAYLFFGGGGPSVKDTHMARRVKLGSNMISLAADPEEWDVPYLFEASDMKKLGDTYYFSYSVNTSLAAGGSIAYIKSTEGPLTGFNDTPSIFLPTASTQLGSTDSNVHHAMFEFKGKTYITYHTQKAGEAMGVSRMRTASIDYMPISDDGAIPSVTMTRKGVEQVEYLNPYVPNEAETIGIQGGVYTRPLTAASNRTLVTSIDTGDWLALYGVDFGGTGATKFTARVRMPAITTETPADYAGAIEIRLDPQGAGVTADNGNLTPTSTARITGGEVVGRVYIKAKSGEANKFTTVTVDLYEKVTGVHNLVFVFYSSRGVHPETTVPDSRHKNCFEFDQWQFE